MKRGGAWWQAGGPTTGAGLGAGRCTQGVAQCYSLLPPASEGSLPSTLTSLLSDPLPLPFLSSFQAKLNGRWGVVHVGIDDDLPAARLVCRELGLTGGALRYYGYYGAGALPPVLYGLNCTGAGKLRDCPFSGGPSDGGDPLGVACQGERGRQSAGWLAATLAGSRPAGWQAGWQALRGAAPGRGRAWLAQAQRSILSAAAPCQSTP